MKIKKELLKIFDHALGQSNLSILSEKDWNLESEIEIPEIIIPECEKLDDTQSLTLTDYALIQCKSAEVLSYLLSNLSKENLIKFLTKKFIFITTKQQKINATGMHLLSVTYDKQMTDCLLSKLKKEKADIEFLLMLNDSSNQTPIMFAQVNNDPAVWETYFAETSKKREHLELKSHEGWNLFLNFLNRRKGTKNVLNLFFDHLTQDEIADQLLTKHKFEWTGLHLALENFNNNKPNKLSDETIIRLINTTTQKLANKGIKTRQDELIKVFFKEKNKVAKTCFELAKAGTRDIIIEHCLHQMNFEDATLLAIIFPDIRVRLTKYLPKLSLTPLGVCNIINAFGNQKETEPVIDSLTSALRSSINHHKKITYKQTLQICYVILQNILEHDKKSSFYNKEFGKELQNITATTPEILLIFLKAVWQIKIKNESLIFRQFFSDVLFDLVSQKKWCFEKELNEIILFFDKKIPGNNYITTLKNFFSTKSNKVNQFSFMMDLKNPDPEISFLLVICFRYGLGTTYQPAVTLKHYYATIKTANEQIESEYNENIIEYLTRFRDRIIEDAIQFMNELNDQVIKANYLKFICSALFSTEKYDLCRIFLIRFDQEVANGAVKDFLVGKRYYQLYEKTKKKDDLLSSAHHNYGQALLDLAFFEMNPTEGESSNFHSAANYYYLALSLLDKDWIKPAIDGLINCLSKFENLNNVDVVAKIIFFIQFQFENNSQNIIISTNVKLFEKLLLGIINQFNYLPAKYLFIRCFPENKSSVNFLKKDRIEDNILFPPLALECLNARFKDNDPNYHEKLLRILISGSSSDCFPQFEQITQVTLLNIEKYLREQIANEENNIKIQNKIYTLVGLAFLQYDPVLSNDLSLALQFENASMVVKEFIQILISTIDGNIFPNAYQKILRLKSYIEDPGHFYFEPLIDLNFSTQVLAPPEVCTDTSDLPLSHVYDEDKRRIDRAKVRAFLFFCHSHPYCHAKFNDEFSSDNVHKHKMN